MNDCAVFIFEVLIFCIVYALKIDILQKKRIFFRKNYIVTLKSGGFGSGTSKSQD